ncbi:hypothetical protein B7P43_G09841 [Cryptotermes secundus]|uniref:Mos1 transposase HTH domain-containing protein n=1 Tax=Cryptotermes secundus TaxID=105785 RepID=A0A2J7Q356_9NEOP|nr:hypothetical protein B7P43_G09841 [Cryptotermes secundus]
MQRIFVKKCFFCDEKSLSLKAFHNWIEKFTQGQVADDARPGLPVDIAAEAAVQKVEELIRADRRISIDSVATALGYSHGGVLLHHDNARPPIARATPVRIHELQLELLEYPPYSLDLAPSDFHLFGPLKKNHFVGKRLVDVEKVEMKVRKWLRQ